MKTKKINKTSNLETIEYKSLSEITADLIRKEIITGKLLPGLKITENDLSLRLGVSRVVVREALISLTKEGFCIKEKNKFTKVVEFSKKDISDIFDLRIALEVAAANKCIELGLIGAELLESKSHAINKLANKEKLNDMEELVNNDIAFHELIIESSDNTRLINTWKRLSNHILILLHKYVINRKEKSKGMKISYNHGDVIEAYSKRNTDLMQKVITKHIMDTKKFLLDNYSK